MQRVVVECCQRGSEGGCTFPVIESLRCQTETGVVGAVVRFGDDFHDGCRHVTTATLCHGLSGSSSPLSGAVFGLFAHVLRIGIASNASYLWIGREGPDVKRVYLPGDPVMEVRQKLALPRQMGRHAAARDSP